MITFVVTKVKLITPCGTKRIRSAADLCSTKNKNWQKSIKSFANFVSKHVLFHLDCNWFYNIWNYFLTWIFLRSTLHSVWFFYSFLEMPICMLLPLECIFKYWLDITVVQWKHGDIFHQNSYVKLQVIKVLLRK